MNNLIIKVKKEIIKKNEIDIIVVVEPVEDEELEYRFFESYNGSWKMLKDYSKDNTCQYNMNNENRCFIMIQGKKLNSDSSFDYVERIEYFKRDNKSYIKKISLMANKQSTNKELMNFQKIQKRNFEKFEQKMKQKSMEDIFDPLKKVYQAKEKSDENIESDLPKPIMNIKSTSINDEFKEMEIEPEQVETILEDDITEEEQSENNNMDEKCDNDDIEIVQDTSIVELNINEADSDYYVEDSANNSLDVSNNADDIEIVDNTSQSIDYSTEEIEEVEEIEATEEVEEVEKTEEVEEVEKTEEVEEVEKTEEVEEVEEEVEEIEEVEATEETKEIEVTEEIEVSEEDVEFIPDYEHLLSKAEGASISDEEQDYIDNYSNITEETYGDSVENDIEKSMEEIEREIEQESREQSIVQSTEEPVEDTRKSIIQNTIENTIKDPIIKPIKNYNEGIGNENNFMKQKNGQRSIEKKGLENDEQFYSEGIKTEYRITPKLNNEKFVDKTLAQLHHAQNSIKNQINNMYLEKDISLPSEGIEDIFINAPKEELIKYILTAPRKNYYKGAQIVCTLLCQKPAEVFIKYELYLNGKLIAEKPYSMEKTYAFTPPYVGTYKLVFYGKKTDFGSEFKKEKEIFVAESLPVESLGISCDKSTIICNEPVTFMTTVVGGKNVVYEFYIFAHNQWQCVQEYSEVSYFTLTPQKSGTYKLLIMAKNFNSKEDYDEFVMCKFDVKNQFSNLTDISSLNL